MKNVFCMPPFASKIYRYLPKKSNPCVTITLFLILTGNSPSAKCPSGRPRPAGGRAGPRPSRADGRRGPTGAPVGLVRARRGPTGAPVGRVRGNDVTT